MDELDEIIPYISNKKFVSFLGAGFSAIAGCGDWDQLKNAMLNDDIIKAELPDSNFSSADNPDILEYCFNVFKTKGKERFFWRYVSQALTEDVDKYKKDYFSLVKRINSIKPFPEVIVTTNVDNLLEKAKMNNSDSIFFKVKDFDICLHPNGTFYIHGHIHNIERSVFIRSRYVSRYNNAKFRRFLTNIAKNNSILFLGSRIEAQMKDILVKSKNSSVKHFMLVSNDNNKITDSDMALYKSEFNMNVIRYGDRKDFTEILSAWIDKNFPVTELTEPKDSTQIT